MGEMERRERAQGLATNRSKKEKRSASPAGGVNVKKPRERQRGRRTALINKDEGPISLARTRREESCRATRQTKRRRSPVEPLPSAPCWPRRWRRGRSGTILKKSARRLPQPREAKGEGEENERRRSSGNKHSARETKQSKEKAGMGRRRWMKRSKLNLGRPEVRRRMVPERAAHASWTSSRRPGAPAPSARSRTSPV